MYSSFGPRRPNFPWKINGNARNGKKKSQRTNNFIGEISPCSLGSGHSKTTNGVFWCGRTLNMHLAYMKHESISPVGKWFSRFALFADFLPVLSFGL